MDQVSEKDIAALIKLMSDDNQESEATDKTPDDAPPKVTRRSPPATRE